MKSNNRLNEKTTWIILALILITQIQPIQAIANSNNKKKKSIPKSGSTPTTAPAKRIANSTTYLFIGNKFSKKYHKPACEYARKMNVNHVLLLKTKKEAYLSKYKECNWCMPLWTKSVSSKLLNSK